MIFQDLTSRVIDNRVSQRLLVSVVVNVDDNVLTVWRNGYGTSLGMISRVTSDRWTDNVRETIASWRPLDVANQVTSDLILALSPIECNGVGLIAWCGRPVTAGVQVVDRLLDGLGRRNVVQIMRQVDVVILVRLGVIIERPLFRCWI